jgi:hypothetical protein
LDPLVFFAGGEASRLSAFLLTPGQSGTSVRQRPVWQQSILGDDFSPMADALKLKRETKEAIIKYFIGSPDLHV